MIIKYSKPKGRRLKKQFWDLVLNNNPNGGHLYWNKVLNKWMTIDEWIEQGKIGEPNLYNSKIKTLKSAIRHLKKHTHYLPKSSVFRLVNKYVGCDIFITI